MQKTQNYSLPQWEGTDRLKRADFNTAMGDIDGALASKAEQSALNNTNAAVIANTAAIGQAYSPTNKPYVVGSYTGDGMTEMVIELGFNPSFLIITGQTSGKECTYIAISGGNEATATLAITDTGFAVKKPAAAYETYPLLNQSGKLYHYFAVR